MAEDTSSSSHVTKTCLKLSDNDIVLGKLMNLQPVVNNKHSLQRNLITIGVCVYTRLYNPWPMSVTLR